MNWFTPARRFNPDCVELMDRLDTNKTLLREELQVLEKANWQLGGHHLMLQCIERFIGASEIKSLNVLDLATGAADIPRAIVNWARKRQLPVTVTAVDNNPEILNIARELCRDWPEIRLEQHDLRALPYAENSFDLVLCSLAMHHFDSTDVVAILRRIQELARVGYIVNDLRRNWFCIWTTDLLTPLLTKSSTFRNDAAQSCRAAFTVNELRELAEQAGLNNFQIKRRHLFFHMTLEGLKTN
ncbi:MAG TPA: methyltransferase domain-containing protein [Verrucomicrobiae bacterium]|nr:methyltransferase domain-containing protein [Verrucomicrobiae bacterium]